VFFRLCGGGCPALLEKVLTWRRPPMPFPSFFFPQRGLPLARQLHALYPWLKIVISMREPIARAISYTRMHTGERSSSHARTAVFFIFVYADFDQPSVLLHLPSLLRPQSSSTPRRGASPPTRSTTAWSRY
jgi:hypothetical protein